MEEHELLELFLFGVIPRSNTNPIAHGMIDRFGSLIGVFSASYDELLKVCGVGKKTARYIKSAFDEEKATLDGIFRKTQFISQAALSNYLIYHSYEAATTFKTEDFVIEVFLDSEYKPVFTRHSTELDAERTKHCLSQYGAHCVVIGLYGEARIPTEYLSPGLAEYVLDVLRIKETCAVSIKETLCLPE